MIQPLFGFFEILGLSSGIVLLIIIMGGLGLFLAFFGMFCLRKVKAGEAGVRTGSGGMKVTKDYMFRIPLLHRWDIMDIQVKKLEVARKGKDGLICADNIRADIEVAFYVRVEPVEQSIKDVAEAVGCERASEVELLKELFEAKFSDALKTAGKQMEFANLYTQRTEFRSMIGQEIGQDLNGYLLEDVAIDYLEQTPKEDHDPSNVLDAQGIEKIVRITSELEELANERERQKEMLIKDQNVRAQMHILQLEQTYEQFLAQTQKQLDDELAKVFPDMETVDEIRSHIWDDHPVWSRLSKLEEDVALLKSNNPPS